jgi:Predicted sugar kinase
VFAVYYRPDLRPLAEEFKSRYGAVDLTCGDELSHVFILGGDGTLLEALRRFPCVLDSVVVHLGMGRVNFYRSAEFTIPVEEAVEKIRRGEYRVLEFSTLEHDGCRALNEISIYRGEPGRLLSFRVRIDEGEVVGRADGVIIFTLQGISGYVGSTLGLAGSRKQIRRCSPSSRQPLHKIQSLKSGQTHRTDKRINGSGR